MNEQASAWLGAVDGLGDVHERLRRVVIRHCDATDLIKEFDGSHVVIYADAPYVHSTRSCNDHYACEMTDDEHRHLIEVCLKSKSNMMLSMYHHPIYDVLHEKHGWKVVEFTMPNHLAGGTSKRRMVECLWMNY
jgi:DNA adenine methylase